MSFKRGANQISNSIDSMALQFKLHGKVNVSNVCLYSCSALECMYVCKDLCGANIKWP